MRATSRAVLIVLLAGIVLAGCTTTYPAQVLLDPARFDDGSVRLEWAIGMDFFNLKITNLTDAQITQRDAAMIPPKAYIVLGSRQGAVFGTDILGRFNAETEEKYPLPANPNGEDRLFLKSHSGETLRLYLSAIIKGRKALLDVPFKISGASRVQSASGDNGPATTAPAATPPAAKP
jgi:hypothetical protein